MHNQIGGAARLAAPSSYRSTSALEAIRANLAIPLAMALKMRSKSGCEASNLLCSAIRNNATIEGTWIFGGWRLCPSGRLRAHRSVQIHFFGRQKNSTPSGRALYKIRDQRNSRRYAVFFVLIFLLLDGMLKRLLEWVAGKKNTVPCGPRPKKKQKMKFKKQKICGAASALEPAYRSVLSAILK